LHYEEAHGEQARCTYRTQTTFDKSKMNGFSAAPPVSTRDTALVEKGLRGLLSEAQPLPFNELNVLRPTIRTSLDSNLSASRPDPQLVT
jgi:hypothetical protein